MRGVEGAWADEVVAEWLFASCFCCCHACCWLARTGMRAKKVKVDGERSAPRMDAGDASVGEVSEGVRKARVLFQSRRFNFL